MAVHKVRRLINLSACSLECDVTYTITRRVGQQFGAGTTVVDLISINTLSGADVLGSVSAVKRLVLKMDLAALADSQITEVQ